MIVYHGLAIDEAPDDWRELDSAHVLIQSVKGEILAVPLRNVGRYENGAPTWLHFYRDKFFPTQLAALLDFIQEEKDHIRDTEELVRNLQELARKMKSELEYE